MNFEALPREFYNRSALGVSPDLLGHFLLHQINGEWVGGEIVETEAYIRDDPASHAYVRETPRNRVMWGLHGHAYVFRIYGAYYCVNAVCRVREAVLIRAVEPRFGLQTMREQRPVAKDLQLTNGPSKLCIAMGIDGVQNGLDLTLLNSPLIIAANPDRESFLVERAPTTQTTRIGLTRAADWPLRWILSGSRFISRRGFPSAWPPDVARE
jgi:DNA-3-methyladenine glycosylase